MAVHTIWSHRNGDDTQRAQIIEVSKVTTQRVGRDYYCSLVPSIMGPSMWVCVCVCTCACVCKYVHWCLHICVNVGVRDTDILISSLLVTLFKAIFRIKYFPPSWTRVFHPETWEISGFSLILSSHKSA